MFENCFLEVILMIEAGDINHLVLLKRGRPRLGSQWVKKFFHPV